MARGHLNWSVKELAGKAGIGISTVRRMESFEGVPVCIASNIEAVQRTLEAEGIAFIGQDETSAPAGPGVRLRQSDG